MASLTACFVSTGLGVRTDVHRSSTWCARPHWRTGSSRRGGRSSVPAAFSRRQRVRASLVEPIVEEVDEDKLREIVEELRAAKLDEEIGMPFVYSLLSALKMGSEELDELATEVFHQLRVRKILRWFGAFEIKGPSLKSKSISVQAFAEKTGIPLTALAPKKTTVTAWQFAGVASAIGVFYVARLNHLDMYAQAIALGGIVAFAIDQTLLRGTIFESIYRTVLPHYREKVVRHEAGHFLLAYLLGCPLRGYAIDAYQALVRGIPGQAGTIFTDPKLQNELSVNKLTQTSIDRYTMVVMAGIAAEALHYGQAEGGSSDENSLISLLQGLRPAWEPVNILQQARWSAQSAILLLRQQRAAYEGLVQAMSEDKSLGECIQVIEEKVVAPAKPPPPARTEANDGSSASEDGAQTGVERSTRSAASSLDREEILKREEKISQRLSEIENILQGMDEST